MIENVKRFAKKHKVTIIAVTATAVPLIVQIVRLHDANRQWISRNGCYDKTDHLLFSDHAMEKFRTGSKRVFGDPDNPKPSDLIVMSHGTYDKELGLLNEFKQNPESFR